MSDPITIQTLIEKVLQGVVRIPKFQRDYVWQPDNVAFLMDSLYRGYPVGSLLLWRTSSRLSDKRDLGPFTLPEPEVDYPIDYVLDGQQRITSIFGVFQTRLTPDATERFEVYFDLKAPEDALEGQFAPLTEDQVDRERHFPLRILFDAHRLAQAYRDLPSDAVDKVSELHSRFSRVLLPVERIEFKDKEQIAIIFERINRAGMELDTFDLLSAWTWSTEFELSEKFEELSEDLEPFGFGGLGSEQNLLLKCCSAVIGGTASVSEIVNLNGPEVRKRFDEIIRGFSGAIDFLRAELNVHSMRVMPYPAMLVPLVAFFATDRETGFSPNAKQRAALKRWFWRSCFARRYSGGVGRAHANDIAGMRKLREDSDHKVSDFSCVVGEDFFLTNKFSLGSVNSKTHILLLATFSPKSFLSGASISTEEVLQFCNRNEFHHIFPKNYLKAKGVEEKAQNCLANICFLSAHDNRKIRDKAPSVYKDGIPPGERGAILDSHAIPEGGLDMTFDRFSEERARLLAGAAAQLID